MEFKFEGKTGPSRQRAVVGTTSVRNVGAYYDRNDSKTYSTDDSSSLVFKKTTTAFNIQFFTGVTAGTEVPSTATSELVLDGTDFYVKAAGSTLMQASTAGGGSGAPYGDGKVDSPAVAFTDETNSGFYRIGADNVGLAINGIKRADFGTLISYLADNDGTTNFGQLVLRGSTDTNKYLTFCLDTTNNRALVEAGQEGTGFNDLLLGRNGSASILIGTTSNTYSAKLFVNGSAGLSNTLTLNQGTAGTPSLRFNSDLDSGIYYSSGINIAVNGTSRMSINTSNITLNTLKLKSTNANTAEIKAPSALSASYSLTFPADDGQVCESLSSSSTGICAWLDPYVGMFGGGADGDLTLVSDITLTRETYYNNLTFNSSFVLNTSSFRIFVSGTLTFNGAIGSNGIIRANGTAGIAATSATGAAAPATPLAGSFAQQGAASAGATSVVGVGAVSVAPTTATQPIGGTIGAGSVGGTGAAGAGGTSRAVSAGTVYVLGVSDYIHHQIGTMASGGACGCGGSSGAGSGALTGGGGGSGGNGGGIVMIYANIIEFKGTNTAPIFAAIGGVGGAGFTPTNANTGGGGGGGGGGCGAIIVICRNIVGAPPSGWIYLAGGNGGNGGNGSGTGGGGGGGSGGGILGGIVYYCFGRNTSIAYRTVSLGPVAATSPSGITGGTGASGRTYSTDTY